MRALTTADQAKVLAIASSQLGTSEVPAKSNRTPYGAWYGLDGNAWCAMFVSWCYYQALQGSPFPAQSSKGFAYCPIGANWFKQNKQWAPPSTTPQPGWVVFFDFPRDGVNRISHVGIVAGARSDGRINTLEGNTNGAGSRTGGNVMAHQRSVAGGIVGYGMLHYGGAAPGGPPPMPVLRTTLAKGNPANVPEHVLALQQRLNLLFKRWHTSSPPARLAEDGDFGERTDAAVRWFKTTCNGLLVSLGQKAEFVVPITGQAGPRVFSALWFWTT